MAIEDKQEISYLFWHGFIVEMRQFLRRTAQPVQSRDPPHPPVRAQYPKLAESTGRRLNRGVRQGQPADAPQTAAQFKFFHQGNRRHSPYPVQRGAADKERLVSRNTPPQQQAHSAFDSRTPQAER